MTLKSIAKEILKAEKIALFGHVTPDLDSLGSAFSLYEALSKQFKKVVNVFADGKYQRFEKIINISALNSTVFSKDDYDLIIVVDTSSTDMLGSYQKEILSHDNIILIDHHQGKQNSSLFTNKNYIDSDSSSASELIYLLLKELGAEITPEIASYLYAGITSDTNSFLNDNVKPSTLKIAGDLYEKGAEVAHINRSFFKTMTKSKWDLTKIAYSNAEIFDDFAILGIKKKELNKIKDDGEGVAIFANQLANIEGIKISCVFTEKNLRTFNCSFRCKYNYVVNSLAEKFGGGGHKLAAGCTICGSYKDVRNKIIKAITESIREQEVKNG